MAATIVKIMLAEDRTITFDWDSYDVVEPAVAWRDFLSPSSGDTSN
jgi:hypothetical protein